MSTKQIPKNTKQLPSNYLATTKQIPSNYKAITKWTSSKYQADTKQLSNQCQAITKQILNNYQTNTKHILSNYQAITKPIQSKYQANTKQIPSNYQANTKQIPSNYLAKASTWQIPSNYPAHAKQVPSKYEEPPACVSAFSRHLQVVNMINLTRFQFFLRLINGYYDRTGAMLFDKMQQQLCLSPSRYPTMSNRHRLTWNLRPLGHLSLRIHGKTCALMLADKCNNWSFCQKPPSGYLSHLSP